MKTLIKSITAVLMFVNICLSETGYKLEIANLTYTSERSLEFDIYILNADSENSNLRYSLGQYFLDFNPQIANGGTLTYSIVSSSLPESMQPRNASISGNQLRLACNLIGSDKNNLPVIPSKSPGLLISKMRLETSADKFSPEKLNLKWSDEKSKFHTKIFSFDGNKNIEMKSLQLSAEDNTENNGVVSQKISSSPKEFSLSQNYPNPFNPVTTISYSIPRSGNVLLKVYDMTGKEISTLVNGKMEAGSYEVTFNGANFSSGIYFYRLTARDFVKTSRMILIK